MDMRLNEVKYTCGLFTFGAKCNKRRKIFRPDQAEDMARPGLEAKTSVTLPAEQPSDTVDQQNVYPSLLIRFVFG